MINKAKLKGFTMLEMLIVLVIIGILAVVLTESYITISKTALRIEQEKNVSEESLILTQVFQSLADETTIDYDKYDVKKLTSDNGYTDTLYLKSSDGESYIISTDTEGKCLDLEGNPKLDEENGYIQDYKDCKLILKDKDGETVLNTSGKVVVSKVKFRIIPYDSDEKYFSSTESDVMNKIHQPGFWMFIHLYSPLYQVKGTNNVHQTLQLFFNLKNIKGEDLS